VPGHAVVVAATTRIEVAAKIDPVQAGRMLVRPGSDIVQALGIMKSLISPLALTFSKCQSSASCKHLLQLSFYLAV